MQVLLLCLLSISLLGDTVDAISGCNTQIPCNSSILKQYNETLCISCIDLNDNCTWSHVINGVPMPIEEKFTTNNHSIITLLGYYDNLSYGNFIATNSTGDLCYYLVVPPLDGTCNNCTGIKVNGSRRKKDEDICIRVGGNMMIQADVPLISSQHIIFLRFDGYNSKLPSNCIRSTNLTYNCNNLTAINNGKYCIHVEFIFSGPGVMSNPEWQSNNVTVLVQSISVSFAQSKYYVNESTYTGQIQPMINITDPLPINITLEVLTINGTAFGNDVDYGSGTYIVTIPAGAANKTFEIKINNDDILEGNETFALAINISSLPNCITLANPNETTVIILEDDAGTVSFVQAIYKVSENSMAQVTLNLSKSVSKEFSVEVFSTSITALGGEDYNFGPYNIVFPAGQTNASLNITIRNDKILERNENFTLTINSSLLPSNINPGDLYQTTVTIVDNDVATVKFEMEKYCINKSYRQMLPEMTLNTSSSTTVTIQVYGTPFGQKMDTGPFNVTFPAGKICAEVPLTINISEGNKAINFTLHINSSLLPSYIMVGNPAQTTVTTLDNYCNVSTDITSNDGHTAAIVGGIFGGLVPLIVIIITIIACAYIYCKKHCSNGKTTSMEKQHQRDNI